MSTDYPTYFDGQEERILSLKPRRTDVDLVKEACDSPNEDGTKCCAHAVVGEGEGPAIIPRDQWPADGIDFSHAVEEILDQNGYSLCHSFAGTAVNEIAHHMTGHKGLRLSAGNLAGQVTGHQDEGAGVDEVLAVLIKSGQTTRKTIGQNDYEGNNWPPGWNKEAKKFRIAAAYDCGHSKVFDAIITCLILGWVVEIGTNCFGGGHAVTVVGFFYKDGQWWLLIVNSWGKNWTNCGKAGYAEFPENKVSQGLNMFGAWGLQASVPNPDDVLPVVS